MLRTLLCLGIVSFCLPGLGGESSNAIFHPGPLDANGWRHVAGKAGTNYQVYTLSASTNLIDWNVIAVTHGESFDFIDPASAFLDRRFYRFSSVPYADYWRDTNGVFHATNLVKNQVIFPGEPFATGNYGANEDWVKFLIVMDDPTRVYYTGSGSPYHYDFASTLLEPFIGISPAEFEQISMLNEGRRLLRGTVLFPRNVNGEYGIQFVGTDPLPPQLVLDCFRLVRSTVTTRTGGAEAFYIPTYDQYPAALAQAPFFATNAIAISSPERWSYWDTAYSGGYAVGRLKFVSSAGIANAYASGQLHPEDILITDGIPAEVPYVAGIITLTPATANSHVAILAKSYGVPFVYLADEAERSRVMHLVDREIVLQAAVFPYGAAKVLLTALDPDISAETRAEMLSLREPETVNFEPLSIPPYYWTNAQSLYPSDIQHFGGKAANCGLLLRVIPSNTPPAIAFSFRLWSEFMDQELPGGIRLRTEISNRLSGFSYPPNVAALKNVLAGIRTLIRNNTQFSPALEQVITNALGSFDSRRNIRFRSSTNVEDSENFSGAGLYDSYSGCLADDRDDDASGPSICDETETDERGVFRAIRRVFASFYNDNAFMERLRLGVDESTVGMAVLVHHSTPDPLELANGVATVTRIPYPSYAAVQGKLVTQYGAVSVTNPDGTALPEQYDFEASINSPNPPFLVFRRPSSLLPLGASVLETREYYDLINLLTTTTDAYAMMLGKTNFVLDFEYKKVPPARMEVKQVREIPQHVEKPVTPFLLNEPAVFETFQGIYGYLWPAHRLKSRWTLENRNVSATSNNLAQGLYTHLTIEHLNGTNVETLSGPINTFSNFVHRNLRDYVSDQFTMDTLIGPADIEVATYVSPNEQLSSEYPFTTTRNLVPYINATLRHPVESVEGPFSAEILTVQTLSNATLRLTPKLTESSRDAFRQFTFKVPGKGTNIYIRTSFWLGAESTHGDRPPLIRFVETQIEGLTTVPIKLTNYWSQTFNATHFPGMMHFLFEPRLEPSVTPAQRAELHDADVAAIYVHGNGYKDHRWEDRPDDPPGCYVLKLVGLDNTIRDFSDCDFGD